ncbi:MAG: AAA family ATPase [Verrucomicrobiae bacterium]|nr:AAA family ATPase [Verrucomicrobiae bacterium]
MKETIKNHVRAGYPGIYLISAEEARVESELKAVAGDLKHGLHIWSITTGLVDVAQKGVRDCHDAVEVLQAIGELPENTMILLRDWHVFWDDPNPVAVRMFKEELRSAKTRGKTIIALACRQRIPPELEREIVVMDFSLPTAEELETVLDGIAASAKLPKLKKEEKFTFLDAAKGMTTTEAENAFALSVVETGELDAAVVARQKAETLKKNGLLEVIETAESLDSVGGLDALKDWLRKRKEAFSRHAVEYGLPSPKGLLILGIPGTGKSLTAKATAAAFGLPLLKLDAGRLYGGLVGQSEGNVRSVIQTAEAMAPCVLWIDEIEKGFNGSKSSGATDGGTSSRVFGSFLSWMQDKKAPVFIVATANDVSQLPPEMLRKGRFDELFFVDLPNQEERQAIWGIQIAKHGRNPSDFDLGHLAKATEGFTGAEIEQAFVDALFAAFAENKEPGDLSISEILTEAVPLSRLMAEQINELRKWSKGRARPATNPEKETLLRRIAA